MTVELKLTKFLAAVTTRSLKIFTYETKNGRNSQKIMASLEERFLMVMPSFIENVTAVKLWIKMFQLL